MTDVALRWDAQRARADFELASETGATGPRYLRLDGNGAYVSTPVSAAITTSIGLQFELRARVSLDDWTPAGDVSVLDQVDDLGTAGFFFGIQAGGSLMVGLSEDGGAPSPMMVSTEAVQAADGAILWIRATIDQVDVVTFYTSTGGLTWTQLGDPVPVNNGIYPLTEADLFIGEGRAVGGPLVGGVYYAAVLDGFGGSPFAVFDPSTAGLSDRQVVAVTGETWTLSGSGANIRADTIELPPRDLETDEGLETAVIISLFTDARAAEGDVLPDGGSDRRGFWGDAVPVVDGDQVGSKLWLLGRAKQTPDVLARAQQYAQESLAWLVEDQVASQVEVTATTPRPGMLALEVTIHRPKVSPVTYRYAAAWAAQAERG
jgi:phage gp46-like protein